MPGDHRVSRYTVLLNRDSNTASTHRLLTTAICLSFVTEGWLPEQPGCNHTMGQSVWFDGRWLIYRLVGPNAPVSTRFFSGNTGPGAAMEAAAVVSVERAFTSSLTVSHTSMGQRREGDGIFRGVLGYRKS